MNSKGGSHKILIVGGGSAGIAVASRLKRANADLDIAIIDAAEKHYYQPLWTLVGGGEASRESTQRNEADLIPTGVTWIQKAVASLDAEHDCVRLEDETEIGYEVLILCPGIQVNWSAITGLAENLGTKQICSNYSFEHVEYTWDCIRNFGGGTALFTQPSTVIKCAGAPQKIAYLAADHFRNKRGYGPDKANVVFATGLGVIFGVKEYAATLNQVIDRYAIDAKLGYDLSEIRADEKIAVFRRTDGSEAVEIPYDMIHATPPMGPPNFIADSSVAGDGGWIDVDKYSCRHTHFENVFALGDASSLPTSRTGAAARAQAQVVAQNVLAVIQGKKPSVQYDGYTSCPLVTGYGKLVLAEFGYDGKLMETFPFDQTRERWSMYQLKKHLLPPLYWHVMMKGLF